MKQTTFLQPDTEEHWLSLREVAAKIPGRPHVATVTRWTQKPVRGRTLPSSMFGGKRLVKYSDLIKFLNFEEKNTQTDTQNARHSVARTQVDALLN